MRSLWSLFLRLSLFALLLAPPLVHAQTTCAVNGATGSNAVQGCIAASPLWTLYSPAPGTNPQFTSKAAAQQGAASVLTSSCPQCSYGILGSPLVVPPGDGCTGAACDGSYSQDLGVPFQHNMAVVVIWGYGVAGNPSMPIYYGSGGETMTNVGRCPIGYTRIFDNGSDGNVIPMCEPPAPQTTMTAPPAVIPTMTNLDSVDNGTCRTCQGVNLADGTKQAYAQDMSSGSPDGIDFSRYYNSATNRWSFNYNRAVVFTANATNNTAYATLTRPDGSALNFTASTSTPQATSNTTKSVVTAKTATTSNNVLAHVQRLTSTTTYPWVASNKNNQTFIAKLTDTKDSNGVITGFDYVNLHDEDEHYDANGRLTSITARSGNALTFTYDSENRLARVDDAFGRYVVLTYTPVVKNDAANTWDDQNNDGGTIVQPYSYYNNATDAQNAFNLASVSDGTQTVQYHYSTLANTSIQVLDQVTNADGTTQHYGYDPTYGLLSTVTDENGVAFENYTYTSAAGHSITVSSHVGTVDHVAYQVSGGGTTTVTDPEGNGFTLGFSGTFQGKTQLTYQSGPCTVCGGAGTFGKAATYDAYGNQTSITDFLGNVTNRVFDTTRGLPTSIIEAAQTSLARTTTIAYSSTFRLPRQIVEPIVVAGVTGTRTTAIAYDANGNLLTQTVTTNVPSGTGAGTSTRTWTFTYNAKGQTLSATGPRTDVTSTSSATYDSTNGNLLTSTDALGHVTTLSNYTPEGLVGKTVDPNGLITTYAYDALNRIINVQRGSSATHWEPWHVVYTPTGMVSSVVMPNGTSVHYVYDTSHRLTEIQELDELQNVHGRMVYTLNDASEITQTQFFDANNNVVASSTANYDYYGRLQHAIGSANQTTTYTHDLQGNLTALSDPLLHSYSAQYDALNRLTQTTDALNGTATMTLDVADNLTAAKDPRSHTTTYQRNGFDEISSTVSPDTGTTTAVHDADGNVTHSVDASGRTTDTTYDALDRPTHVVFSHGGVTTQTQTFTYDTCTNGIGHLCSMTDGSGSTMFNYDLFGRVSSKTQVVAGTSTKTFTLVYARDNAGQITGITYPSGQTLSQTYSDGRVVAQTLGSNALLSGVTYLPFGGDVKGWTWAVDSSTVAYTYDQDEQPITVQDVDTRTYAYDKASNLTGVTDPNNANYKQAYTYDAMNRVSVATTPAVSSSYAYDINANRTSSHQSGTAYTFTIDANSNRYTAVGAVSITTDAAGNITSDGTNTYTFDDTGRMATSINPAGLVTTYAYNALGQRVKKSNANGITYFVYDEQGLLRGTYDDASGNAIEELVYLESRPVADVRGTTVYRVLTDPLTTPRKLIDTSGTTVWSWDGKEAFGASAPTGSITFNLRFPGQYADLETGLFNNGFRDYAPSWGRYVESDPIGLLGGWNTYGYVGGNPLTGIDIYGKDIYVAYYHSPGSNVGGHIGIGVNGLDTYGLYSAEPGAFYSFGKAVVGITTQGIVSHDIYRRGPPTEFVVIPTTPEQDSRALSLITHKNNLSYTYNLYSNDCATFVEKILINIGVNPGTGSFIPSSLFDNLSNRYGAIVPNYVYKTTIY